MRKFQFKLEALKTVRKDQESRSLRILVEAQTAFRETIKKKEALVSALNSALSRRENGANQSTPVSAILIEENFIVGTKLRINQADREVFNAKKKVDQAMRVYAGFRKNLKIVEKLEENAKAEFIKAKNKRETKTLDEMVVTRFRLKGNAA